MPCSRIWTCYENIAFGLRIAKAAGGGDRRERVTEMLDVVEL